MAITLDTIVNKVFKVVKNGYDNNEVESFLDEILEEMENREAETNKLKEQAEPIYEELSKYFSTDYDTSGSIGKRYRRQDEIGTPFCITYDFDSEEDGMVTVRDRDTMEQERIKITDLKAYFEEKFTF